MQRFGIAMCALICAAGCEAPKMSMEEMFATPDRPAELAKLDRFVGTWSGTAEMVSPTAAEMNEMITDGTIGDSFAGGGTHKWVLDDRFLMSEGWYEMPNGERVNYVSFMTWDTRSKKFRSWHFSENGEFGSGSMKFEDDDHATSTAEMRNAKGEKTSGKGELTFVGDNKMDWTWQEGNLFFKMKLKGSSTKQ